MRIHNIRALLFSRILYHILFKMKKLVLFSVLLFSVALIVGCGGPQRPPGFPRLYECVLVFQFEDGSPVDRANVSLIHEDIAMQQWSISGVTDSAGTVKIYTNADFAGAPTGKYKVLIQKNEYVETNARDEYGDPVTDVRHLVNEKYSRSGTTTLSLEVPETAIRETFKVEK